MSGCTGGGRSGPISPSNELWHSGFKCANLGFVWSNVKLETAANGFHRSIERVELDTNMRRFARNDSENRVHPSRTTY